MIYQKTLEKVNRDLDLLAPIVRKRLEISLMECNKSGYPVRLFEGRRSNERQIWLWSQGRTRPGKIVTNAGPWQSTHIFGLGVDIVFFIDGKWSWEGEYDKVANIFQKGGFKWLFPFEKCHFEITGGLTTKQCEIITKESGIEYLWDMIEEIVNSKNIQKLVS